MADLLIDNQYDFFKAVRVDEDGNLLISSSSVDSETVNSLLEHFGYDAELDQLIANRTIVTILNTFSLSNIHDISSIGENVIFKNNASKVSWSPAWGGIKEQHLLANQGKLGIIQPSARTYEDLYLFKQGTSAASSGSVPYESTSVLPSSSGVWSLKPTVAENVLDTDYIFYEIYYGSDDTGLKSFEQHLTGIAFNIGESLYSLSPTDNQPLDRWFFRHPSEFHKDTELYFRLTKADSRDGARTILNVRPDSVNSSNYYTEVSLRDFTDLDLDFVSPFLNYEGLDFSTDATNTNVIFSDYITGQALKPFFINELKAIDNGNNEIEIYIKEGSKTYVKSLELDKTYIDSVLVDQDIADAVNELNSLFSNTGTSSGAAPIITSSLAINLVEGESFNYTLNGDFGTEVVWDFSNALSVTSKNGNNFNLIGGDLLSAGTHNIPVILLNSNGSDSETLVVTVASPSYSNTKAISFNNNDFLRADALTSNPFYRSSNGSGSSDAWSFSAWFKGGTNGNDEQTIFCFGGNDVDNEGHVWLKWDASGGDKKLVFRYGTKNNRIVLTTDSDSYTKQVYRHILVTYDGGTTGQDQGQINDYYSRFKIFINGVEQTLTTSHNNDGWSGEIKAEFFKIGEASFGGDHMRNGCILDEVGLWSSDESSNISAIYNGGDSHDLALLSSAPSHYWRMGDDDIYPTIKDVIGSLDMTMNNMTSNDIVNDVS